VLQLQASPAHVSLRREDLEGVVGEDASSGFIGELTIETDGAGEDQSLSLFATRGQTAIDEGSIEPFPPAGGAVIRPGCGGRIHQDGLGIPPVIVQ
jgi:hypothetical protein